MKVRNLDPSKWKMSVVKGDVVRLHEGPIVIQAEDRGSGKLSKLYKFIIDGKTSKKEMLKACLIKDESIPKSLKDCERFFMNRMLSQCDVEELYGMVDENKTPLEFSQLVSTIDDMGICLQTMLRNYGATYKYISGSKEHDVPMSAKIILPEAPDGSWVAKAYTPGVDQFQNLCEFIASEDTHHQKHRFVSLVNPSQEGVNLSDEVMIIANTSDDEFNINIVIGSIDIENVEALEILWTSLVEDIKSSVNKNCNGLYFTINQLYKKAE